MTRNRFMSQLATHILNDSILDNANYRQKFSYSPKEMGLKRDYDGDIILGLYGGFPQLGVPF